MTYRNPLTILHTYGGNMTIGGHYRSGLAMAKKIVERGHRVIVIAPAAVSEMAAAFHKAGAELKLLPDIGTANKLPGFWGWESLSQIVENNRIDIIHSMDFKSAGRGYRAAVATGKQFICTEAGGASETHFPPRKSKVVIFSEEQKTIYRDLFRLPECNLKVLKARIDTDAYSPEPVPADFIDEYHLTRDGVLVGIICRLETNKEHKIRALINFAKNFNQPDKKINIHVVGDGDQRATLQAEAGKVDNPNASIRFLGPIYDVKRVNWLYNFCDIIIGSGRGIMEAMACRKPVIICGEAGEAELLGPNNIEKVAYYNFSGRHFRSQKNAESLSKVLGEVCGKEQLLSQHASFGFNYINKYLSAAIGADQLLKWYKIDKKKNKPIDFFLWYLEAFFWLLRAKLHHEIGQRLR